MKQKSWISLALAGALLSGCVEGNLNTSSLKSLINGNVADGYLIGAKVCIDENINFACDDGEVTTYTGEDGYYEFNVTSVDYPIVVEVTTDTIDTDTNQTVEEAYTLSTNHYKGGFISPITSLITEYYLANSDQNITVEDARTAIAEQLGLESTDDLFTDYMQDINASYAEEDWEKRKELHQELHTVAKLLVYTKQEVKDALSEYFEQSGTELNGTIDTNDSSTMNLMCNEQMMHHMKTIKEESKNLDWKNEDNVKSHSKHMVQDFEISNEQVQSSADKASSFKDRRDKNQVVNGYVSSGAR